MRLSPLLLAVLLLPALLIPLGAQGQGPVTIFITAPDAAGTGESIGVNVTAAGGPGEDNGTFELRAWLEGPDLAGAAPLEDVPLELSSENNTFTFNATMPLTEQIVTVVVEINSTLDTAFQVARATHAIQVLVPLRVTARVENRGEVAVQNIPVFLAIDDVQVQETRIDRLNPGETQVVEFSHLPLGLGVGAHTVEVRVDINKDGVIDAAIGEVALRTIFYKEGEPLNPLWIGAGVVAALVVGLLVWGAIRRRREAR